MTRVRPLLARASTQGRSTVRLPTFAGRKRPSLKVVVPAILDAVMALPDQGGVRWRDVNPSSFTVVDDQRECGNLAALERNFLVRRAREPSCGAEGARALTAVAIPLDGIHDAAAGPVRLPRRRRRRRGRQTYRLRARHSQWRRGCRSRRSRVRPARLALVQSSPTASLAPLACSGALPGGCALVSLPCPNV